MSRIGSFLRHNALFKSAQHHFFIDIGSTYTKILLGERIVWHQPTVIAWHVDRQTVLAVGDVAAQLTGKTSQEVQLLHPIQSGVVADLPMARAYLETVLASVHEQLAIRSVLGPRCTVAISSGATPVEMHQLKLVLEQAGVYVQAMVPKPVAALHQMSGAGQRAAGVIDIGGQTVEIGLFVSGEPVLMRTLTDLGGDRYTTLIQERVKSEQHCEVSWQVAEKIKRQIGRVTPVAQNAAPVTVVRGRDAQTGSMSTVRLDASMIVVELRRVAEELLVELQLAFAEISAEVITPVLEQGLWLCGGGAQLTGLDQVIAEQLQTHCVVVSKPDLAVVNGLRAKQLVKI